MTFNEQLLNKLSDEFKNIDSAVIAALINDDSDENYVRSVLEMLNNEGEFAQEEIFDLESIPDLPRPNTAKDEKIIEKFGQKVFDLHGCFPRRPAWVLEKKLQEFDDDMEKTIDWLLNEEYLHENPEESVQNTYKLRKNRKNRNIESDIALLARVLDCSIEEASVYYNENAQNLQKTLLARNVLGFKWLEYKSPDSSKEDVESIAKTGSSMTYHGDNANIDKEKINHLYAKAREYYEKSKSNHLLRGAAHYYSIEAQAERDWHYSDLIKRQTTGDSVDFHNIPTNYALETCRKIISEKRLEGRQKFTIITGIGRHSVNNVPKTKNAIRSLLNDLRINYYENDGSFDIIF